MISCVVDASVAAKWFNDEIFSEKAHILLSGRYLLGAPDFFLLEMDNVFCKWTRRKIMTQEEALEHRTAIRKIPVNFYSYINLQDSAYLLAISSGCGIYDCLYIALAIILETRMVTADRRLYDALAGGPFGKYLLWIGNLKSGDIIRFFV